MAFVVFAGQSNTGGAYMDASTVPAAWAPDPKTLIWDNDNHAWVQMQPGVNTGFGQMPQAWGAEVQFAIDFRRDHPDEVLRIVKYAWGGTRLAPDTGEWRYDWSPDSVDELFDRTAAAIRDAGQAAGGILPGAVFWGQGEEDANYRDTSAAYAQNLPALFSAIRAEWLQDPNGHIGFFRIAGTPAFGDEVRKAELDTDDADPNAWSFDTRAFPLLGDNVHYSAAAHQMIGDEYYRLFQAWQAAGPAPVGSETLAGTAGDDTIFAGVGDDHVSGGDGHDVLRGEDGADTLVGGAGFDDLQGNVGDDVESGGDGDDWVVGGKDNDRLNGDAGADIVYGNLGADTLSGDSGADLVRGGQGNDVLAGGDGDDWLSGDRGDDTISAGFGYDTIHGSQDAGLDWVTDFAPQYDRVQLDPGTTYTLRQDGEDTVIDMGGANRIVLAHVRLADLPAGWIFGA